MYILYHVLCGVQYKMIILQIKEMCCFLCFIKENQRYEIAKIRFGKQLINIKSTISVITVRYIYIYIKYCR